MEIHALQTGTVRVKQFQLTGASNLLSRFYQLLFTQKWSEWMPIYSWLIKLDDKLILVDAGDTADIYEEGYLPKGGLYHKAVETRIKAEEEIPYQLKALGYDAKDVQTVILTHLHGDHIGGIKYFPHARFIAPRAEYELAYSKKGPGGGYFVKNWPEWFKPEFTPYEKREEGSFAESYVLSGSPQIILVPTPGHSVGHQSVIVKDDSTTYFIAADLTYNTETLQAEIPNVLLPNKEAQASVQKTHAYVKAHSCIFLSAHDKNVPRILADGLKYGEG